MKMRRTIAILAAVCAVFAFTGMAMAQNRVEVKVTSEPLGYKALCDKAGGFSLEFDRNTTIAVGDQITIDLSYISPADYASICKAINFEISAGGNAANTAANRWDVATIGNASAVSPFYFQSTAPTQVGDGIYFRVVGAINTQRITLDVMGAAGDSVTVGNTTPDDKLILTMLDQKSNATDWTTDGIWTPAIVGGLYTVAGTASDNTLCVNVSAWSGATVKGNMDSQLDKYTFIPSDPQIAHIAPAASFAFANCTKVTTGRILCGAPMFQGVDSCISFDYETAVGYVTGTHSTTNRVIISSTSPFPVTNYQVRLEILVNGLTGDNGVYWVNDLVGFGGYDTPALACAADLAGLGDLGALLGGPGTNPNYTYLNGAGAASLPVGNVDFPGAAGSCDIATTTRAVSLTTPEQNLGLAVSNDNLLLDIPRMRYDLSEISQDDVVSVRVSLIKAPCGTVFQGTLQIGTMCAATVVPALAVNTVVYPYFTGMNATDNWWDGFVLINMGAAVGNFTALVYELDGDFGSFTGTIDPNGMYLNTLDLAGATLVTAGTGPDAGTLGDSQCYILVCTDFTADGFAFMGSRSTNSLMANESMGYIPRVDYYNANDSITMCNTLGITPGVNP